MRFLSAVGWVCLGLLAACEDPMPPAALWVDPATIPPVIDCAASPNQRVCEGDWSALCGASGAPTEAINCALSELTCVRELGCLVCTPNAAGCTDDNEVYRCDASGDTYEVTQTCALGTVCNATANTCIDLCDEAEQSSSYVGCDYWAVTTSNSQLDNESDLAGNLTPRVFEFEIVIANPQNVAAQVTIERANETPIEVSVNPSAVTRVKLPWVEDLVGRGNPHTTHAIEGAYHVVSSVPVTIYQFNPMEFSRVASDGNRTFSFTNDASLLLPTHVLTGNYTVMSQAALDATAVSPSGDAFRGVLPGFVAIVGVDDSDIEIEIVSSAFTAASPDGVVPALSPGQTVSLLIGRGDVIQLVTATPETCTEDPKQDDLGGGAVRIYCAPDPDYDLTGTTIRSTGRVSVIAGHDCARVPFNVPFCDHLEESLFPEEVWGRSVPIAVSATAVGARNVPDVVRVLSASDGNRVTFQPQVHSDVVLDRGAYIEFVVDEPFVATGTDAIMVAQFLVGQHYGDEPAETGDPAMSLGIPSEQWRNSYAFMTPSTYEDDFVSVIAPQGATVMLDDVAIDGWQAIEGTQLASTDVSVRAGQHRMTGTTPFGITAYGYALYTSYAYPGGLDLRVINGPE